MHYILTNILFIIAFKIWIRLFRKNYTIVGSEDCNSTIVYLRAQLNCIFIYIIRNASYPRASWFLDISKQA